MDQQTFSLMYSSKGQEWYTPLDLYRKLNDEFHFTTDPCAEPTNRLECKVFYTKLDDGLSKEEWPAGNVFVNPPYGKKGKGPEWVKRCVNHAAQGLGTVVMLIPARTDTRWFHDFIWQKPNVEIRFIRGRLKFDNPDHKLNTAPFPSMIVVFRPWDNNNNNKWRSKK